MSEPIEALKTYDDLGQFLTNWRSAEDPDVYDFGGIVHLWLACLDNIRQFAIEGELEDLGSYMSEEQRVFLLELARLAQSYQDEDD